ncbi:hypothetical protein K4H28_04625 [Deefgea tanakiae]|uniref:Uncharacterized protein n=1 Tax=Deefgea tanakiae TaxID=2865840 RepID=A0ABX8Z817_9NEIS|nr:hypothetical protein [Deefgea tanakiae]QZA78701.1 hypothetical protein K4H28_04625 [Deefgea tanakiae]
MSKPIYFASSPHYIKRLPDYQTLARTHRLSYVAQAHWNDPKDISNIIPGPCALPAVAGMHMLKSHSDGADYDFVDLEMYLDGPTSDDDEYIDVEIVDENDCDVVARLRSLNLSFSVESFSICDSQ